MDLTLDRPEHIEDEMWEAISAFHARLIRAVDALDRPQCIGSMKELLESIAKVVVTTRGEVVEPGTRFPTLISRAHAMLERQPGMGLAESDPLRSVAQGAKTIATQFAQLRNEVGTGHGRAYEPLVEDEVLEIGLDAGILWSRWALRRLSVLAYGLPSSLIRDLQKSTFRSGALAGRLEAADLAGLTEAEQRRVGVAVGQRAMRETFIVRAEGVRACAESTDLRKWPVDYRIGVLNGLFFSQRERLTLDEWMATFAPLVIAQIPELEQHLADLLTRVSDSANPLAHVEFNDATQAHMRLLEGVEHLPEASRPIWLEIVGVLDPGPF